MPSIPTLVLSVPGLLYALVFHEYAHALSADLLGDPTARKMGRLTLDPWPHLDFFGVLCFLLFRFGWAKPVPVDERYFKRPRRDFMIVALAGPFANLVLSLISFVLMGLTVGKPWAVNGYLTELFNLSGILNLYLLVFNVIPIPPLDGSKVLAAVLPRHLRDWVLAPPPWFSIVLLIGIFYLANPMSAWLGGWVSALRNWEFAFLSPWLQPFM